MAPPQPGKLKSSTFVTSNKPERDVATTTSAVAAQLVAALQQLQSSPPKQTQQQLALDAYTKLQYDLPVSLMPGGKMQWGFEAVVGRDGEILGQISDARRAMWPPTAYACALQLVTIDEIQALQDVFRY
jgi:hypothetical protein